MCAHIIAVAIIFFWFSSSIFFHTQFIKFMTGAGEIDHHKKISWMIIMIVKPLTISEQLHHCSLLFLKKITWFRRTSKVLNKVGAQDPNRNGYCFERLPLRLDQIIKKNLCAQLLPRKKIQWRLSLQFFLWLLRGKATVKTKKKYLILEAMYILFFIEHGPHTSFFSSAYLNEKNRTCEMYTLSIRISRQHLWSIKRYSFKVGRRNKKNNQIIYSQIFIFLCRWKKPEGKLESIFYFFVSRYFPSHFTHQITPRP